MAGRHKIKRIRCTRYRVYEGGLLSQDALARILTFSSRGTAADHNLLYFVHRYNPHEFDAIVGKSEKEALEWLDANGWTVGWIRGAE